MLRRLYSSSARIRPRRALLYMQGHDAKKLAKASSLQADCVCLDMEDGVAFNKKLDARNGINQALGNVDFGASEVLVRINAFGSGLEKLDLEAAMSAKALPHGIVLPKTEGPEQLRWLDDEISKFGDAAADVKIICLIESPMGLLNLRETLQASSRLVAVIFGADDYAAAAGAVRTVSNHEVDFARNWIATHAAAYGVQSIDLVNINLNWEGDALEVLRNESERGFEMGYSGKQVIHPKQIAVVQQAFTPKPEVLDFARRLVAAHDAHQESGKGAFVFEGKMIDLVRLSFLGN
jgi:citrate lyase subunit beta-like protein